LMLQVQHFRLKATRGSRIFLPFDRVLTSLSAMQKLHRCHAKRMDCALEL
jgi:hypothetical protein